MHSEATIHQTCETPRRLPAEEQRAFEPLEQPDENYPTIVVDVDKTFQTIEEFGEAFTDATADTLTRLSPEAQQRFLTACFDPVEGCGYTLRRRRSIAASTPRECTPTTTSRATRRWRPSRSSPTVERAFR